ncbi:hypothetical protein ACI78T_14755 [Blastococcus sp. SYSU D00922]
MTQIADSPAAARVPASAPAGPSTETWSWRWSGGRPLLVAVVATALASLALRIWLVGERWLYEDDFYQGYQGVALDLFSPEFLFENRGGHLFPGALLLQGALYRLAPLEWWPSAVALVLIHVLATIAVLRLVRVLVGDRPAMLTPFAVFLFGPLSLGAFGWWSAATQSMPYQVGLAWFVGDAVLLARTGRRRHAITGTLALVGTLAFFERAILMPFLAFALVTVLLYAAGERPAVRAAWRRGRGLWAGSLGVLLVWAIAFVSLVPAEESGSTAVTVDQVVTLEKQLLAALVPALVGGPWQWADLPHGTPLAEPPTALPYLAAVLVALVVVWTSWRRVGALPLWMVAGAFAVASTAPVAVGRAITSFAEALPLTYRYYAGEAVLLAIVAAVLVALPSRQPRPAASPEPPAQRDGRLVDRVAAGSIGSRVAQVGLPLVTLLFVASSVVSTVAYVRAWESDPAERYITTARASLAAAGPSPLLDQPVPDDVVWGLSAPYNNASRVFGPLEDRPEFADATDRLQMLDDTGSLRPAAVDGGVIALPGPAAGCGWAVSEGGTTAVAFGSPLFPWMWTARLDYVADRDGEVLVSMGTGEAVPAPVRKGANTVYVRLVGDGAELRVTTRTSGLSVCVSDVQVGNIVLR